jgi:hypothetical protein
MQSVDAPVGLSGGSGSMPPRRAPDGLKDVRRRKHRLPRMMLRSATLCIVEAVGSDSHRDHQSFLSNLSDLSAPETDTLVVGAETVCLSKGWERSDRSAD